MINKAITFAVQAHSGQLRKGTKLPYIVHPMEVCAIVSRMTDDEDVLMAAILHDVLEDCKDVTEDQIYQMFGGHVAALVSQESEDKSLTWQQRKQHTLDRIAAEESEEVLMIALADKLSNVISLSNDYHRLGEKLWERFNMKDKSMQGWYYKGLCKSLSRLSSYPEYREFCRLVADVFQ